MRLAFVLALLGVLLIAGCAQPPPPGGNVTNNTTGIPPGYEVPDYCTSDSDCLRQQSCCDCGLGEYVNKYNYNNTTCTGPVCKCVQIPSKGECRDNKCTAVPISAPPANNTTTVPPGYEVKDYCRQDSDCVRLNSCCDCGLGQYVNIYNQQPECTEGPSCMCPIALSHGECEDNKCIAVANVAPPPPEEKVSIFSGHGECGSEEKPTRTVTSEGLVFEGRISAPNPCHKVSANVKKTVSGGKTSYALNLTTSPTDAEVCVKCLGYVPWQINITGFFGPVDIYYDGKKVYPDEAGFCGWSTNGSCFTDADCITGGCSGQVCQARSEEPAITTCEFRECYDNTIYGVGCGCVAGKCQWG
ncbi:MAG: eight-cysteine-cluster domain-containing protein [Candidatus Micrarchaeota archaeon]